MTLQDTSQLSKPVIELWTPGEDEILKARVAEGVTYARIAMELGRQRGSCAARARRLGLKHPNQSKRPYVGPKSRIPLSLSPDEHNPDSQFKPFAELASHECRYPHGDDPGSFLFCAAGRIDNSPYCQFHHDLTHRKVWWNPEREFT